MTKQAKMPKPAEAAQSLLKALANAYDDPSRADVRDNGMSLAILAVEAGFVQITPQKLSETRTRYEANDFIPDLSAAIKEARLRGWVGHGNNVQVLPAGLDHGRFLLRPWQRKMGEYFKQRIGDLITASGTAAVVTVITNVVLRLFGWA